MSEEEVAQLAAVAATVKVEDLRFWGCLTHLSPPALYRLMFGFASISELTLCRFNGNQLMDDHFRECGRKQICDVRAISELADAGPLAVSDEALRDYLFAPEYGMPERSVSLSAFTASQQFVQNLVSRAQQAAGVERIGLVVKHLPLRSQQLGGLRLVETEESAVYCEELENGADLWLGFGPRLASPDAEVARTMNDEEESEERFSFTYSQGYRVALSVIQNAMKIWSILLVAFFPSVTFGEQASCDGCGAYDCIEDRKQCGADGYPIAYGLKYCKRFFEPEVYNRYNDVGKEFIKCTRDCLIRKLQDQAENNDGDCDELTDFAFESHEDCYVSCGFCRIWTTNKVALMRTYDLRDFFSKRALEQVKTVAAQCFFGELLKESMGSCDSILELMMKGREKCNE